MRLRHKPWAEDFINAHPEIIIPNPEELKGNGTKNLKITIHSILKWEQEKVNLSLEWQSKIRYQLYWN